LKHLCLSAAFMLTLASPALAETAAIGPCDHLASAENLVEPWEDNARTFADGAIRVAILDTAEPAAAAFHLLVLSPPLNELGLSQCRLVSLAENGMGFAFLSLERLESDYDPGTGLQLVMDMGLYVPESGLAMPMALAVTINQATGEITGQW